MSDRSQPEDTSLSAHGFRVQSLMEEEQEAGDGGWVSLNNLSAPPAQKPPVAPDQHRKGESATALPVPVPAPEPGDNARPQAQRQCQQDGLYIGGGEQRVHGVRPSTREKP